MLLLATKGNFQFSIKNNKVTENCALKIFQIKVKQNDGVDQNV